MAPAYAFHRLASLVSRQGISNDISSVKSTFSSWDSCMSKSYCKWPVIAAIIIGSLIALSVLFCVVRCCCCGLDCCCGICSCCNACCPGGRRNRRDYQPAPQQPYYPPPGYGPPPAGPVPWQPSPQPQFQPPPQSTMMYGGAGGLPSQPAMPQTAHFESAPKGGARANTVAAGAGDQLPAMPSWGAAREHHVEDTSYDPAEDRDATRAQESIPLQEQRRLSPDPSAAYRGSPAAESIPLQDRRSPPVRSQTQSPQYDEHDFAAPSGHGFDSSSTAFGAGLAAVGATGAPSAAQRAPAYPPEKPALNTTMSPSTPAAFARMPPVSPVSPVTPAASSIYSTNPPPSYHTNAFQGGSIRTQTASPPTQQQQQQAYAAPPRQQSPYTAYTPYQAPTATASPPPLAPQQQAAPATAYQAYNPFVGAQSHQPAPSPSELGGTARAELSGHQRAELGSGSWAGVPQRRPL